MATWEKMLNVVSYHGNANQFHNKTSADSHQQDGQDQTDDSWGWGDGSVGKSACKPVGDCLDYIK